MMEGQHAVGSVAHTLLEMRGVWHDHCQVFTPAGDAMAEDASCGTPGAAPWDNLVYVDFDGEHYRQTNVTFRGRPLHVRTFVGRLVEGVLHFARLGPDDPGHVGVSGGPLSLFFAARRITEAYGRYAEPDCIHLLSHDARVRTTLLYRDGALVRCLSARGRRLADAADRRVLFDPRGLEGAVHGEPRATHVFTQGEGP